MRGLALSGGGFRATLFHLGLISYLYDVERAWHIWEAANGPTDEARPHPLSEIKHIASVSGGSILAAHLTLNWEKYTDFEEPDKFAEVSNEIVAFIQNDIRGRIVRRLGYNLLPYFLGMVWRRSNRPDWKMPNWFKRSTTDSLGWYYNKLFRGARLWDLDPESGARPHLSLLSVNLSAAGNNSVAFTYKGLQSYNTTQNNDLEQIEYEDDTELVGRAVAASSAFPGLFNPLFYNAPNSTDVRRLSDGGIYDNLGVRKFLNDIGISRLEFQQIVVSDASVSSGAKFGLQFLEPITVPIKAADVLFRRVYEFEVAAAKANPIFKIIGLRNDISDEGHPAPPLRPQYRLPLYRVRTDLDRFSDLEVFALIRQGYTAASQALKLPLPEGVKSDQIKPWNPTPHLPVAIVNELVETMDRDSDDATIRKITRQLGNASERTIRLFRLSDPITILNLTILFSVIVAGIYFLYFTKGVSNNNVILSEENNSLSTKVKDQGEELYAIKRARSSYSDIEFGGTYVVPLQTDLTLEDALASVQKAKQLKFRDSYVFLVSYENNQSYRTFAVYNTAEEAKKERDRAMSELRPSANEYFPFEKLCNRKPLWYAEKGYYICTALGAEQYGFDMIITSNIDEAIRGFDLAVEIVPDIHNASEINNNLLKKYQNELKTADLTRKNAIWKTILETILNRYTWGMNAETKTKLIQRLNDFSEFELKIPEMNAK